jgi:glycosyltransferase involved in cell wall biosynthesis
VRSVDALTGRLTDRFVAITNAVGEAAARDLHTPRARLAVVPRGVDLDRFQVRPVMRDATSPLRVLSVGRLVAQKDHRTAIAAVRSLHDAGVPVTYTIVGEGPLATELARVIEAAGLRDVVTLMHPTRDVVDLMRRHDVFCFPSVREGLGNALIEAMACGRPVVVSDIPTLREVTGDLGVYFPPGDAAELAARLRDVACWPNSRLNDVGLQLRSRAERLFAAPMQSMKLGDIYRQLLSEGRHGQHADVLPAECMFKSPAESVRS